MNTYIRIYCSHYDIEYPEWFWMVTGAEANILTPEVQHQLKEKTRARIASDMGSHLSDENVNPDSPLWHIISSKFLMTENEATIAKVKGGLMEHAAAGYLKRNPEEIALIRESGSWMTLTDDHTILEVRQQDHFPSKNEGADIVVCENDNDPEPDWIEYLKTQYPEKTIRVLNLFRARSVEELTQPFKDAELITFKTTFTNFDWWELAVETLRGIDVTGKSILGYCPDEYRYKKATELLGDLPEKMGVRFLTTDEYYGQAY